MMRLFRKYFIRCFFHSIAAEILNGELQVIWGEDAEFRVRGNDMREPTQVEMSYDSKVVVRANTAEVSVLHRLSVTEFHYSDAWGKPLLRQYHWKRYWRRSQEKAKFEDLKG